MPNFLEGANEFTIKDIEEYLNSEGADTPAAETTGTNQPTTEKQNSVTETQAFAHRLKEATMKAREEERQNIAKSLGFESYEDLQKNREKSLYESKGLDPEEVAPVIEEIVEKRLKDDPRMQELESYREKQAEAWAKKELEDLKQLTGGKINNISDVPEDVLNLWKTKGSLKEAYLQLKGEELIREMRGSIASKQNSASTEHLKSPRGTSAPITDKNVRPFTDKEKAIYKMFNPDVTDDELSKMTKNL